MFAKIDARDRAQAVSYAYQHGLTGASGAATPPRPGPARVSPPAPPGGPPRP
jgi:hypothetical protein